MERGLYLQECLKGWIPIFGGVGVIESCFDDEEGSIDNDEDKPEYFISGIEYNFRPLEDFIFFVYVGEMRWVNNVEDDW